MMTPQTTPEVIEVAIKDIVQDARLQVRAKLDVKLVAKYAGEMEAGAIFPAVTLGRVDEALLLVGGWHRLAAYRELGVREVEATVAVMTFEEALWAAADDNRRHGKPLTRPEIRTVFRKYMEAGKYKKGTHKLKSYREIGEELNIRHNTIHSWMRKDYPRIARKMGGKDAHKNPEAGPAQINGVRSHLTQAKEATEAVLSFGKLLHPEDRWEVIEELDRVLAALRSLPHERPAQGDF